VRLRLIRPLILTLVIPLAGCAVLFPFPFQRTTERPPIFLWCDATANLDRLGSTERLAAVLDRAAAGGVTGVVIDVRPISGHVLYDSRFAPRLERWPIRGDIENIWEIDPDFNVLTEACHLGHERGLEVYASVNVFAEGHKTAPLEDDSMRGPAFSDHPGWAAWDYIQLEGEEAPRLRPTTEHRRSYTAFASPHHPEVRAHALNLIREVVAEHDIDGIVLDRVRYDELWGDFSPWARHAFEEHLGHAVEHWPEDVYERTGVAMDAIEPGPLFDDWLLFRARTIRDFIAEAHEHVQMADPGCVFADYVGAWYPICWEVGVNWASPRFEPRWEGFPEGWRRAGYADQVDALFTGNYFYPVTPDEIPPHPRGLTGDWLSVEGSAALVREVVKSECPVIGSLYVEQYLFESPTGEFDRERFARALRAAYHGSDGLMIFDLVHLEQQAVWDVVEEFGREVRGEPSPSPAAASDQ
jgi:Domain of unknown function/Glycosyl hydrolase-like 10